MKPYLALVAGVFGGMVLAGLLAGDGCPDCWDRGHRRPRAKPRADGPRGIPPRPSHRVPPPPAVTTRDPSWTIGVEGNPFRPPGPAYREPPPPPRPPDYGESTRGTRDLGQRTAAHG